MTPALSLFTFTVRQTLWSKKVLLALLMFAGPCALVILIRTFGGPPGADSAWTLYHMMLLHLTLGGVTPLVCMIYGPALIRGEADAGTIVYLLTRRMHRATVTLIRYLATTVSISALVLIAMVALHLLTTTKLPPVSFSKHWTDFRPVEELRVYLAVGPAVVAAYLAVFVTLNALARKGLIVSGLYFVVMEMVVANIPTSVRIYTISHQLRKTVGGALPAVREFFPLPSSLQERFYPAHGSGWLGFAVFIVGFLLIASLLVSFREQVPERIAREG